MENEFNGSMFQSLDSTDNLSVSYEMIDGIKTVNDIEILSDNVNLEEIVKLNLKASKELLINNRFYEKRKVS